VPYDPSRRPSRTGILATAVPVGAAVAIAPGSSPIDLAVAHHSTAAADAFDEQRAVEAVLHGDREAFRLLVDREAATVVRACYRVLGDRHDAEDAAQEAFVIAYRSLPSWRGEGSFGAWLGRIAIRVALRQAARRRTVQWTSPLPSGTDSDPAIPIADTSPAAADPALLAVRAERTADLRTAVAKLDEPYRETVALRFFADRSLAEIATETGRPLGTVKTHLHRGLQRLREVIGDTEMPR
jgi:RNA polymerase sigma-70 factor (ECF subfamily)